METQNKWGGAFWAVIFAVVVIGGSSAYSFLHQPKRITVIPGGETMTGWQSVSSTVTQSSDNSLTGSLSEDLYAKLAENTNYSARERDVIIASLVKERVVSPAIVPNINLVDLNISDTASLDTYSKLLVVILSQANQVKKYEVTVFTQSVMNDNIYGTPALQSTADLYKRIGASLLIMEVPKALATEHLEVVKSVGALARAVENMAKWKGDPIEALSDVDTFNKAKSYTEGSVDTLLLAVMAFQNKT